MALVYRIVKNDESETVFFNGVINEDAELPLGELLEKMGTNCILNLKEIHGINSLGVRAWIHFMRHLEVNRSVVLEECTPEIINQINMIPNFKGNSIINSLYARYICDNCEHQQLQFYKAQELTGVKALKDVLCEKCGTKMEMEDIEEDFLAYFRTY